MKLDDLGIFFGPEDSDQAKNGILYFLYNCLNYQIIEKTDEKSEDIAVINPVNTLDNPESLKKCNIYQLMKTENYKDVENFKKKHGIHPNFVNFITATGYWHNKLEKIVTSIINGDPTLSKFYKYSDYIANIIQNYDDITFEKNFPLENFFFHVILIQNWQPTTAGKSTESTSATKDKYKLNLLKVKLNGSDDKITNFENSIPYLPVGTIVYYYDEDDEMKIKNYTIEDETNKDYLRKIYSVGYKKGTNDENLFKGVKLDLNMSAVADGIIKARTSDFTSSNLEKLFPVNLAADKKENLIYQYDGAKYVNSKETSTFPLEELSGLKDSTSKVDFINRCILNDDETKHLNLCLSYLNDQDYFNITNGSLIDLNLAKKILRKFKIAKYKNNDMPEEYNEWLKRMGNIASDQDKQVIEAIKKNGELQKYLKALIELVKTSNLVAQNRLIYSSSRYVQSDKGPRPKNKLLQYIYDNMQPDIIINQQGGDLAAAQILARGVKYHNATFSMAPLHNPLVSVSQFGRNIGGVQVGGGDANNLSAQMSNLITNILKHHNVSINGADQEGINKMLSELRTHESNIQKFINLLKTLEDVHELMKETGNVYNLNVGKLFSSELEPIINRIQGNVGDVKRCITKDTRKLQDGTDEICQALVKITEAVYNPYK